MKLPFALKATVAALALAAGAAGTAHAAGPIEFLFNGNGSVVAVPCGADCLDATVSGVANDWFGLSSPIPDSWEVTAIFNLTAGVLSGSFVFSDVPTGTNSFVGSLMGTLGPSLLPGVGKAEIKYLVEAGTGLFDGHTGIGQSTVYVDAVKGIYTEAGGFNLAPVPEPSTWALLGGGLLALGWMRRRAISQS